MSIRLSLGADNFFFGFAIGELCSIAIYARSVL